MGIGKNIKGFFKRSISWIFIFTTEFVQNLEEAQHFILAKNGHDFVFKTSKLTMRYDKLLNIIWFCVSTIYMTEFQLENS